MHATFYILLSVIPLVPIQIKFDYNNISFVKNRLAQLSSARNRQLREVWSFTFMEGLLLFEGAFHKTL